MKSPLLLSLTAEGAQLARRIVAAWPHCQHLHRPARVKNCLQQAFVDGRPIIGICATGILIRILAPLLVNKHQDPPVLALDEGGRFVIGLLSGHEGGANELARQLAEELGATWVSTTANAYVRPQYALGMGCERHCDFEHLHGFASHWLAQKGLQPKDLAALCSIDIKADEQGLMALARHWQLPFNCYSAEQLISQEPRLATPSDYVKATVGVAGVAESAALYYCALQHAPSSELWLTKQKTGRATLALARCYLPDEEHS